MPWPRCPEAECCNGREPSSAGENAAYLFLTGSPDRVSPLSRPGTGPGIRPVMRNGRLEGPRHHVPVSCRLSAAGVRFSVIRFPPGSRPSSRSAYRALPPGPRRGLPRFARTSYERGGCLLCPEDDGAPPDWAGFPAGACRFAAASPCAPLQHRIDRADRNETSVGGLSSSPVRSVSRLWPPDGTGALGLLPDASNPAGDAGDARQAEARP